MVKSLFDECCSRKRRKCASNQCQRQANTRLHAWSRSFDSRTIVCQLGAVSVLVALSLPAIVRCQTPEASATFVDVTVIPMNGRGAMPHRTIIVRNGAIIAIGKAESTPIGNVDRVIDGRGLFLTPGLIDMHVHVQDEADLPLYLIQGVTTVRDMDGDSAQIWMHRKIAERRLLGPRIVNAGPILYGTEREWPIGGSDTAATAARMVAAEHAADFQFVKVYYGLTPTEYRGLVTAANRLHMPVIGHVPWSVGIRGVIAARQQTIEHLTGFDLALLRADAPVKERSEWGEVEEYQYLDETRLPSIAHAIQAAHVWNVPTLIEAAQTVTRASGPSAMGTVDTAVLRPELLDDWREGFPNRSPADLRKLQDFIAGKKRIVAALHNAGAGILAGTDATWVLVVPGVSLHQELELLVQSGLTPQEAFAAATREPAKLLRVRTGTVEVGQIADLLLLRGDPTRDTRASYSPVGVMVSGRWLDANELKSMHDSLAIRFRDERLLVPRALSAANPTALADSIERDWGNRPLREAALVRVGAVLSGLNHPERALPLLQLASRKFPPSMRTLEGIGDAYLRQNDSTSARTAYEAAQRVNPNLAWNIRRKLNMLSRVH